MMNQTHNKAPKTQLSAREQKHRAFARKAAAEGMVLLKNEGALPLDKASPIALLGGGAVKTIKGGTGSGDVNSRKNVSICQGMRDAGAVLTSEDWLKDYENRYEQARLAWRDTVLDAARRTENPFDVYAENPFSLPKGRKITKEDLKGAAVCVYVISRLSGEGKDRKKEKGDYYLSERETEELLWLDQTGLPIVLLLNVGAPLELTDILDTAQNIKAVLNISLPGQEGGHAVADVLFGCAAPGGRLTATWARRYKDYPFAENFSYLNGNLETEDYQEGIYVGYRYFDRFGIEPLFPFGYGLSYASFSVEFKGIKHTECGIEITVFVKNDGEFYAGRETVQVYATLPQAEIPKEQKRLIGFAKTKILKPRETQELVISIDQSSLASFSKQMHAWFMDAGTYGLWIGRHAESLQLAARIIVEQQTILAKTKKIHSQNADFDKFCASETAACRAREGLSADDAQKAPDFVFTPQKEAEPTHQTPSENNLPLKDLMPLLYGNITDGASTLGSAGTLVPGSAGETTNALEEKYGIRSLIMADGPAGLRLRQSYQTDRETGFVYGAGVLGSLENGFLEEAQHPKNADTHYQYCTAFPVGTALAQSWDVDLMREFGRTIAAEMEEFHVDLWLAPGMNIQRNPLCGRNFEYYSEDPLLSGTMAACVTDGVQSRKGCGVTLKHFACNNQEDNRMGVNVRVSERTLREIYLRGFEIAVKKSAPAAIMSAYNQINGIHAANSPDLCTAIAREEWRFEGIIMSDWNTTVPKDGSVPWQCIAAGNDLIMPGNPRDAEDIQKAYEQGKLSEKVIRRSAGRILRTIQKLTDADA